MVPFLVYYGLIMLRVTLWHSCIFCRGTPFFLGLCWTRFWRTSHRNGLVAFTLANTKLSLPLCCVPRGCVAILALGLLFLIFISRVFLTNQAPFYTNFPGFPLLSFPSRNFLVLCVYAMPS